MAVAGGVGAVCALSTWGLTRVVLAHAIRADMLDTPNHRSSHLLPTPRGGGAAIVVVVEVTAILLYFASILAGREVLAIVLGGGAVALVGWVDDRVIVHAWIRAVVQTVSAIVVMLLLGVASSVTAEIGKWIPGPGAVWIAGAVDVIGIVWLTNLFNFMDGIDGIAGGTALVSGTSMSVVLITEHAVGLGLIAAAIAGGAAGFIVWNWNPARIFMGDVGSGFLGFAFATLMIATGNSWIIMLAMAFPLLPFAADATATLLRRAVHGEPLATAHREHLYQLLTQGGASHASVALAYGGAASALGVLGIGALHSPAHYDAVLITALGGTFFIYTLVYLAAKRRLKT